MTAGHGWNFRSEYFCRRTLKDRSPSNETIRADKLRSEAEQHIPISIITPKNNMTGSTRHLIRRDAHEWLAAEEARLIALGQLWGPERDQNPRGSLIVPPSTILIITRPLVFKRMTGPICTDPVMRNTNQFYVDESYSGDPNGYALSWEPLDKDGPGHRNGHFSIFLHNISLNCKNRCNGVSFPGDQESYIDGLHIASPRNVGLNCFKTTHGVSMRRLAIIGEHDRREIIAIRLKQCWGVTVHDGFIHRAQQAAAIIDSTGCNINNLGCEHVNHIGSLSDSKHCSISGVIKFDKSGSRSPEYHEVS